MISRNTRAFGRVFLRTPVLSQLFAYAHLRHQPAEVVDCVLLQRETFHIDFVMGVAGLVTMMVWNSLTPDRRDAHVLGTLPITSCQLSDFSST